MEVTQTHQTSLSVGLDHHAPAPVFGFELVGTVSNVALEHGVPIRFCFDFFAKIDPVGLAVPFGFAFVSQGNEVDAFGPTFALELRLCRRLNALAIDDEDHSSAELQIAVDLFFLFLVGIPLREI